MNIAKVRRSLIENRLPLAACVIVGLLVGLLVTLLSPKEYVARSVLYVSAQSNQDNTTQAYQGGLLSEQRVKSYVELLTSDRVGTEVNRELGIVDPPTQTMSEVTASAPPGTVLLDVSVTDQSAERSAQIANTVGKVFVSLVGDLERPSVGPNNASTITVRVVQPADVPAVASKPRPFDNLVVGGLIGLLAGVALAAIRTIADTTIKAASSLESISGAPNLGTISKFEASASAPSLVSTESSAAEGYRQFRNNLRFVEVDKNRKVIVMSSAIEGEGKSTSICNLAVMLKQAGVRVVLVDVDLRKPKVHYIMGTNGEVGLTSVLTGRARLEDVVERGAEGVDVLSSGPLPPNPAELLGSRQMSRLVSELSERYEFVLLDAPPLLPVADASSLAPLADGVILVCRHGKTTESQFSMAVKSLRLVDSRVLGTLLTFAPRRGGSSYGYGYGSIPSGTRGDGVSEGADRSPSFTAPESSPGGRPERGARPSPVPRSSDDDVTETLDPRAGGGL